MTGVEKGGEYEKAVVTIEKLKRIADSSAYRNDQAMAPLQRLLIENEVQLAEIERDSRYLRDARERMIMDLRRKDPAYTVSERARDLDDLGIAWSVSASFEQAFSISLDDDEKADVVFQESSKIYRSIGDRRALVLTEFNLSQNLLVEGRDRRSLALLRRGREVALKASWDAGDHDVFKSPMYAAILINDADFEIAQETADAALLSSVIGNQERIISQLGRLKGANELLYDARNSRGNSYRVRGLFTRSIKDCNAALADHEFVLSMLSPDAHKDVEESLNLVGSDYYQLFVLSSDQHEFDRALASFNAAKKDNSGRELGIDGELDSNLGNLYVSRYSLGNCYGCKEEALQYYGNALRELPRSSPEAQDVDARLSQLEIE